MCHKLWEWYSKKRKKAENFIWAHTCLELAGLNKSILLMKPGPFPSLKNSWAPWEEPGFLSFQSSRRLPAVLGYLTGTLAALESRRSQLSMHLLKFSSQENFVVKYERGRYKRLNIVSPGKSWWNGLTGCKDLLNNSLSSPSILPLKASPFNKKK